MREHDDISLFQLVVASIHVQRPVPGRPGPGMAGPDTRGTSPSSVRFSIVRARPAHGLTRSKPDTVILTRAVSAGGTAGLSCRVRTRKQK
jgi:hypothetical protein